MTNDTDNLTTVGFDQSFQGVTLWLGDGAPCTVEDGHRPSDVRDWVSLPMQRRVMAARLRLIADWLDDPMGDFQDSVASVAGRS